MVPRRGHQRAHGLVLLAWGLALLVPGAAGVLAKRPLRGWFGAFCFALAGSAVLWRDGVVPDPLLAGPAALVVFLGTAGVCAFLYVASVVTSLAASRET